MSVQRFIFMTLSSGSSLTLSKFNGMGYPRVFEGESVYVYRLSGSLKRSSDAGSTWSDIGNGGTTRAICQDSSGTASKTVIFNVSTTAAKSGYYQATPESSTGWSTTGSLPSGFNPNDAVADLSGNVGILVANLHVGTESRIVKSEQSSPYAFSDSDSGIPQSPGTLTANIPYITDLELVE